MEAPERKDLWEIYTLLEEIQHTLQEPALSWIAHDFVEEMWELMNKKGSDYSGHAEHTFKNFEISSELVGVDPDLAFLQLAATKFARLVSLSVRSGKGKKPNFESVEDTWVDLANYIILYVAYKNYKREHP